MPNIQQAQELCQQFISEMAQNRKGKDDAGIARRILSDLHIYGYMRPANRRTLSHWCHTDGNQFKRGMPIAQRISMALEDRIIPRED
jgi:hypothetical protein